MQDVVDAGVREAGGERAGFLEGDDFIRRALDEQAGRAAPVDAAHVQRRARHGNHCEDTALLPPCRAEGLAVAEIGDRLTTPVSTG